ncbi:MAG TPA: TetR/AcrR family transcriptional regulator [Solirubrobacterales bacterium]|nr:TetR/AcrR family transcriptional regulator [Solirubrobacterales bacterium]
MSRRETICNAALESFAANGEVAIEDVRRRSGASIGSIYHHFGGRDGILAAVYVELLREYQAGALRALARSTSAERGIRALVRHHLRWVARNPERARFLLRERGAREAAAGELAGLNKPFSLAVADWVEGHPEIRPMPREAFYACVIGPAQEVSRLWLAGRVPSLRQLEDELAKSAWRAVRSGPRD